jgi:hypothetical protein
MDMGEALIAAQQGRYFKRNVTRTQSSGIKHVPARRRRPAPLAPRSATG